jgi:cytochrome c oxidase cbb3-type subunit IV
VNELRSIVTVISFLTFIGIIWWAWRPGSKQKAELVMSDMLLDDDRKPYAPESRRGAAK